MLQDKKGAPLTVREIANWLSSEVPGITGLLDRLEKEGLITRERCAENDRRVTYVTLTDKGQALYSTVSKPIKKLRDELLGHMTDAEIKKLIRLLEKVRGPFQSILAMYQDD